MWNWDALSTQATQQNAQAAAAAPAQAQLLRRPHSAPAKRSASASSTSRPTRAPTRPATSESSKSIVNASQRDASTANGSEPPAAAPEHDVEHFSKLRITRRAVPAADVRAELSARRFIPLRALDAEPKTTFTDETVRCWQPETGAAEAGKHAETDWGRCCVRACVLRWTGRRSVC